MRLQAVSEISLIYGNNNPVIVHGDLQKELIMKRITNLPTLLQLQTTDVLPHQKEDLQVQVTQSPLKFYTL